jgi:hypothetical protein
MVKKKIIIPKHNIYKKTQTAGAEIVTWIGATSILLALIGGVYLLSDNQSDTHKNSLLSFEQFKKNNQQSSFPLANFLIQERYASMGQIMLKGNILNQLNYDPYEWNPDSGNFISYYFNFNTDEQSSLIHQKKKEKSSATGSTTDKKKISMSIDNAITQENEKWLRETRQDLAKIITKITDLYKEPPVGGEEVDDLMLDGAELEERVSAVGGALLDDDAFMADFFGEDDAAATATVDAAAESDGAGVVDDGGEKNLGNINWKTCSKNKRLCGIIHKALDKEVTSTGYMLHLFDTMCVSKKETTCIIKFKWRIGEPHQFDGRWAIDKNRIKISYFGLKSEWNEYNPQKVAADDAKTMLVLLAGPSASGKSYIATNVALQTDGILTNPSFPKCFLKVDGGDMREKSIIYDNLANKINELATNTRSSDYINLNKLIKFPKKQVREFLKTQIKLEPNLRISIMLPTTLVSNFAKKMCWLKKNDDAAADCLYKSIVTPWAFNWDDGDEIEREAGETDKRKLTIHLPPTVFLIYQHEHPSAMDDDSGSISAASRCPFSQDTCKGTVESGKKRALSEGKPYSHKTHSAALGYGVLLMTHPIIAKHSLCIITHNSGRPGENSHYWIINNGGIKVDDDPMVPTGQMYHVMDRTRDKTKVDYLLTVKSVKKNMQKTFEWAHAHANLMIPKTSLNPFGTWNNMYISPTVEEGDLEARLAALS